MIEAEAGLEGVPDIRLTDRIGIGIVTWSMTCLPRQGG
jgi:hypothetical protein